MWPAHVASHVAVLAVLASHVDAVLLSNLQTLLLTCVYMICSAGGLLDQPG